MHGSTPQGFALLAVLVALSILLGIAVPFLMSMGHGMDAAAAQSHELEAEMDSASVRTVLLQQAARGHRAVDESLGFDSRDEFASHLQLPEALRGLGQGSLLAGEVQDLQRYVNLNSVTPLLVANLLGLATTLRGEHDAEAQKLEVTDASNFPESGWVVVDRELIHYGRREDAALLDLERGQHLDAGFVRPEDHTLIDASLVLDYRCVLVATWPHEQFEGHDRRAPYGSVGDVQRIVAAGFGGFAPHEMDVLRATCTTESMREGAGEWGKPERVFDVSDRGDRLQVRSAMFLAGGTVVRVRTLDGAQVEHALVWSTREPQEEQGAYNLPSRGVLHLMTPLRKEWHVLETVVEPLLPHPVNVNTAPPIVLAALVRNLRPGKQVRAEPGKEPVTVLQAPLGEAEAAAWAREIVTLRGDEAPVMTDDVHPFDGFQDLHARWLKPALKDATDTQRQRLVLTYRNLQTGRDAGAEMATAPISFTSAPVVHYRAAAAVLLGSGREVARRERSGTAVVMPGRALDMVWANQLMFEEAFRLDRRAPFYATLPQNLSALLPFGMGLGTDPAPRWFANTIADVHPEGGLGETRFPSLEANGGFLSATASTPIRLPMRQSRTAIAYDGMILAADPEGHDVEREGPYYVHNVGPAGGVAPAAPPQQQQQQGDARHRSFPFTQEGGVVGQHAVSFWFKLRAGGDQVVYDLGAQSAERDRITLKVERDELVFEVIDTAGMDPEPSRSRTQPERSTGQWRVAVADLALQPETWYHASISARGNRPGQMQLTVDGVPRGTPRLRTYLAAAIPPYDPQRDTGRSVSEGDRFLDVAVESTEGFPEQGLLRIGLELFEYTAKDGASFRCRFRDSFGGRLARMDAREFVPDIPVDEQGRPTVDIDRLTGGQGLAVAPEHQVGAAVELAGFSVPLSRTTVQLQPGAAQLTSALGAFAVARCVNNQRTVSIPDTQRPLTLGFGLEPTSTDDIVLHDPELPQPLTQFPPSGKATQAILDAFPQEGGYALLVQMGGLIRNADAPGLANSVWVGGIEPIRYGRRQDNRLTGITRAVSIPGFSEDGDRLDLYRPGEGHTFVSRWQISLIIDGQTVNPNELPQWMLFVVPISVPVRGPITDPTVLGFTEWAQIRDPANEAATEWVRYDRVLEGHLVRASMSAWSGVHFGLTQQRAVPGVDGTAGSAPSRAAAIDYGTVPVTPTDYIGYTDPIEVRFPVIRSARMHLGFRGDPMTRTTSHAQSAGAQVLPCHRFELDWGNYGALTGRAGRNDRVALVTGVKDAVAKEPTVEWHTVNWSARVFRRDDPSVQGGERLGQHFFQLAAFKEPVADIFVGAAERNDFVDTRRVDRLVKFPSGELPAVYPERAWFGASAQQAERPMRGIVDEVEVVPHDVDALLLDTDLAADARELVVRPDHVVTAFGPQLRPNALQFLPENGGLLWIDGEILAYSGRGTDGALQIAQNGRGLLGTEARAHDEGAQVFFLTQRPAAILAAAVDENSAQLQVQSLGGLPLYGGTLLLANTELLHYTWTVGDVALQMPLWRDPARPDGGEKGLFRGRYGTTPASAPAGAPVVWFPFRYWDRHHARADDPEQAYLQLTHDESDVWFTGITWREEVPDTLVDVECLVRVDGHGSFADDPEQNRFLFRLQRDPQETVPKPFAWRGHNGVQGSRLEARFVTVFRAGAFDPAQFRAQAWKKVPIVRDVVLTLEGRSRILHEVVTAR